MIVDNKTKHYTIILKLLKDPIYLLIITDSEMTYLFYNGSNLERYKDN